MWTENFELLHDCVFYVSSGWFGDIPAAFKRFASDRKKYYETEIQTLKEIDHENIVKYYDWVS